MFARRKCLAAAHHCEGVARSNPDKGNFRLLALSLLGAVSKVKKLFTTKNTKVTQRAQSIDNQICYFVFFVISL
jgi:hypothetical protein